MQESCKGLVYQNDLVEENREHSSWKAICFASNLHCSLSLVLLFEYLLSPTQASSFLYQSLCLHIRILEKQKKNKTSRNVVLITGVSQNVLKLITHRIIGTAAY